MTASPITRLARELVAVTREDDAIDALMLAANKAQNGPAGLRLEKHHYVLDERRELLKSMISTFRAVDLAEAALQIGMASSMCGQLADTASDDYDYAAIVRLLKSALLEVLRHADVDPRDYAIDHFMVAGEAADWPASAGGHVEESAS